MRRGVNPELGMAILRIVLGVVFLTHGSHRLFVGGVGPAADSFATLGIPMAGFAAWFITLLEVGGGIALLLGWMTSAFSVLLIVEMMTGIVLVHGARGWFVVRAGQGGVEFNVLIVAGLLALILVGPGSGALDDRRVDRDATLEGSTAEETPGGGPATAPASESPPGPDG